MNEMVVFKDSGDMIPEHSLEFLESIKRTLFGSIVKLEAQRATEPTMIYNTKLFTDRNEEIWLSGFTCGKPHHGAEMLCVLIAVLNWSPRYVPITEVMRVVRWNNSFRMSFQSGTSKKKIYYIAGNKVLNKKVNLN